jgi:hypothetical protein
VTSGSSPLDGLCGPVGPLSKESPSRVEFEGLVTSGERRLADAERRQNSIEGRFDLAYNAAHALCLAAMRYRGYRPAHRYIVFQALVHTLSLGPEVWRVLDRAHGVRNRSEYEGDQSIDERLLGEVIAACRTVLTELRKLPSLEGKSAW